MGPRPGERKACGYIGGVGCEEARACQDGSRMRAQTTHEQEGRRRTGRRACWVSSWAARAAGEGSWPSSVRRSWLHPLRRRRPGTRAEVRSDRDERGARDGLKEGSSRSRSRRPGPRTTWSRTRQRRPP